MKKHFYTFLATLNAFSPFSLCGEVAQPVVPNQTNLAQEIQVSQIVTEAWLALLDKEQYEKSWQEGSLMFRNTVTSKEWSNAMLKLRKPLGSLMSRSIVDIRTAKDPQGLPAGDYMVYFYKSSFMNKKQSFELVTLVQESDGKWRVLTYQVD